jgi:cation:H+ antiporter
MLDGLMLLGGGVLLYFGAEWLVAGSAGLARSWGVSALLVGLTVVAYGTSAPEVVVGIQAAIAGHPDIALGNVLGSNIANLGLILGATALVRPTPVQGSLARREVPMLVLSALLVPLLLLDGRVQAYEGAALVLGAIAYTAWTVRTSRRSLAEVEEAAATAAEAARRAGGPTVRSRPLLAVIALAGLCGLFVGGKLFVEGAAGLAHMLGMSERLIGLTIIAVGTSVPELATSLIAAWRGHCDIAVGNVVGSNVFNILLCLGTAAIAGSVGAPLSAVAVDVSVMVGFTLFGAFLMRGERTIRRLEGAGLLVSYASFLVALAVL